MSYSVSVRQSVISYTIDVNRRQTRTLTKRWRHIEPQRNEDQQCARNYQHHPVAFWDKLGYTAAFVYTENDMTWYKKTERNIEITRNTKYKYNNPDFYPATHVPQRAATEPESHRAEPGSVPARCGQFAVNYIILELIDMESISITHETFHMPQWSRTETEP